MICLLLMTCLIGWCASPFGVNATLTAAGEKTWNLSLIFKVPPEHHVYEADLKVEAEGLELEQVAGDQAVDLDGDMVFTHDFRREYRLKGDEIIQVASDMKESGWKMALLAMEE